MRVLALEGEVILSDVYLSELKRKTTTWWNVLIVYAEFAKHDGSLLKRLWSKNEKARLNRAKPFEPFSDFRILEVSQGPRGPVAWQWTCCP